MNMRTVEAVIDKLGNVKILEPVKLSASFRALVTILEGENPETGLRPFGLCKDEFIVPDDFDAPLPDDILNDFEGS